MTLKLVMGSGCDAMTGLGVEARTTSVNTDYLLNSGVQPALLTTISGNNLWQNPSPGSSAYMRCLEQSTKKDDQEWLIDWIEAHEDEIRRLDSVNVPVPGGSVFVTPVVYPAMIDGKSRIAFLTAALRESYTMGYRFKLFGDPRKIDFRTCWVCLKNHLSIHHPSRSPSNLWRPGLRVYFAMGWVPCTLYQGVWSTF